MNALDNARRYADTWLSGQHGYGPDAAKHADEALFDLMLTATETDDDQSADRAELAIGHLGAGIRGLAHRDRDGYRQVFRDTAAILDGATRWRLGWSYSDGTAASGDRWEAWLPVDDGAEYPTLGTVKAALAEQFGGQAEHYTIVSLVRADTPVVTTLAELITTEED